MDSKTYRFIWPDPMAPRFVVRDLTLLRSRPRPAKGNRGKKKPEPLKLAGVKLIEIVPHCLYEVPRDCHEMAQGVRELRAGAILSRNLKLTERLNGKGADEQGQCFVSFDGVYKARRGLGRIDRCYRSREIPANRKLDGTLDEMVQLAWELHLQEEPEREAFAQIAVRAAKEYGKPIDEDKAAAQARALQAGNPIDARGRFNPGRLPLICFAGKRRIASRIQAVRGKGRRMSFRELVLEHYIDRLREISRDVSRSQRYRLREEWLAIGSARTPSRVRTEADRLASAARALRAIVSRPFSRSFTHCANDLDEAARLLREAAKERNYETILQAKEVIGRVYRAMIQMECHWRIEDVLLQASILEDRGGELGASQRKIWHEELRAVHRRLTDVDKLTGKHLEDGFRRQVLPRVVSRIDLADVYLMQDDLDRGPDLATMRDELRKAVEPL